MSEIALRELSEGRIVLGMGTSGPQVMESWHGVRFSKPVTRTWEAIEIIRLVPRSERLDYQSEVYQLPLPEGEGVALRSAATLSQFAMPLVILAGRVLGEMAGDTSMAVVPSGAITGAGSVSLGEARVGPSPSVTRRVAG